MDQKRNPQQPIPSPGLQKSRDAPPKCCNKRFTGLKVHNQARKEEKQSVHAPTFIHKKNRCRLKKMCWGCLHGGGHNAPPPPTTTTTGNEFPRRQWPTCFSYLYKENRIRRHEEDRKKKVRVPRPQFNPSVISTIITKATQLSESLWL